jgi:hypothetical protein
LIVSGQRTQLLTGREAGQILLARLAPLGFKAGDSISIVDMTVQWQSTIYSFTEMGIGIDYLLSQNLLERRPDSKESFYLTEQGLREMIAVRA